MGEGRGGSVPEGVGLSGLDGSQIFVNERISHLEAQGLGGSTWLQCREFRKVLVIVSYDKLY